jgi:hypothetical protein
VAHFDQAIPPGGEGKITLRVNLKGYEGLVTKTATVISNDRRKQDLILTVQGTVKPLIQVRPNRYVQLQGSAGEIAPAEVELVANPQPFQVQKTEDNLQGKVFHKLETLEGGRRYRLLVANTAGEGNYAGFIKIFTDHPQKPELIIRVNGRVEGKIAVRPAAVVVGKPNARQPIRFGKVVIMSNQRESFQITRITYDRDLLEVTQEPLQGQAGYVLEIKPRMENIPSGTRTEAAVVVETDVPGEKKEIKVHVVNL